MMECKIEGCTREFKAWGYCAMHYQRVKRHGSPGGSGCTKIMGNDVKRFWDKVDKTSSCWLWQAKENVVGYGRIRIGGRKVLAHRYSYELLKGEIPNGLELDHLCRVPACVNPDHLEPVTRRENITRGKSVFDKRLGLPVGVRKMGKKFAANAILNGKRTYIGIFKTVDEASSAYQKAVSND